MKNLNSKLLIEFLELAAKQLKGKWLLVGGTLLQAVGMDTRPTVDIDLVGLGVNERSDSLSLMKIAESLDLSVESINQAAAFFVDKIGLKKTDLIELKIGKSAIIYRPSVELYWKLKLKRLTESDFSDCKHYLNYCKIQGDKLSQIKLRRIVLETMNQSPSPAVFRRLQNLEFLLE